MELIKPLSDAACSLKIGTYQHYKGNFYMVLYVGRCTETLQELVIYQDAQDESKVWVRPLSMFLENVTLNNEVKPRFKRLE